jgi:hypothetical protein
VDLPAPALQEVDRQTDVTEHAQAQQEALADGRRESGPADAIPSTRVTPKNRRESQASGPKSRGTRTRSISSLKSQMPVVSAAGEIAPSRTRPASAGP